MKTRHDRLWMAWGMVKHVDFKQQKSWRIQPSPYDNLYAYNLMWYHPWDLDFYNETRWMYSISMYQYSKEANI